MFECPEKFQRRDSPGRKPEEPEGLAMSGHRDFPPNELMKGSCVRSSLVFCFLREVGAELFGKERASAGEGGLGPFSKARRSRRLLDLQGGAEGGGLFER